MKIVGRLCVVIAAFLLWGMSSVTYAAGSDSMQLVINNLETQIKQTQNTASAQMQAQTKASNQAIAQLQKQTQMQISQLQAEIQQVQNNLAAQIRKLQTQIAQLAMIK